MKNVILAYEEMTI